MAKKSKSQKKHQFKHGQVSAAAIEDAGGGAGTEKLAVNHGRANAAGGVVIDRDFGYVLRDVRKLSLLVAALVAVELVLWYLLSNTSLSGIYGLFKV